ncbi:MAG: hypothetical protein ACODAJ_12495, partial [Planctomycetota bacterium]
TSFVEPQDLAFAQTDQFTPPPETSAKRRRRYPNQWHLTASTTGKFERALFFTVLRPHRAAEEGTLPALRRIVSQGLVGVTWQQASEAHTVLYGEKGASWEGLETDGRVAAVRRSKGKVTAWLVHGATRLAVDGRAVLTSATRATRTSSSE